MDTSKALIAVADSVVAFSLEGVSATPPRQNPTKFGSNPVDDHSKLV